MEKTKKKCGRRRRHQLLLEVMIAFALIVICVIPLLQPHWFMLRFQQDFIKQVELDHVVNLLYGDMVAKLYANELDWRILENSKLEEIDESMLSHVGITKNFPFKGTYQFKVLDKKSSKTVELAVYRFSLDFKFTKLDDNKDLNTPEQIFHYELTVVRDLNKDEKEEPTKEPESQIPPETPPPEDNS